MCQLMCWCVHLWGDCRSSSHTYGSLCVEVATLEHTMSLWLSPKVLVGLCRRIVWKSERTQQTEGIYSYVYRVERMGEPLFPRKRNISVQSSGCFWYRCFGGFFFSSVVGLQISICIYIYGFGCKPVRLPGYRYNIAMQWRLFKSVEVYFVAGGMQKLVLYSILWIEKVVHLFYLAATQFKRYTYQIFDTLYDM